MLGCFIYLFIGLVIGIILYKIDSQLDVMELDIIGNIFLWPITLIVLFSLMVVYFLMIIVEWGNIKIAKVVDKIWKSK